MKNKFLQGVVGLLALALIVYVGFLARNAAESYNYIGKAVRDRDTITVAGEGKVTAAPDLALISLGVQTEGVTVKDTQTQNTRKMNAIIAALKELKIEAKDIQTSGYSIYPKIDWNSGKQNIVGYTVSQNVSVKVRNLDIVGDVLAKAGELGANQIGGIQFTIDDPTALQDEARGKAIADARKKAQQLADQLGIKILKVVTFSEGSSYSPPTPYPMLEKSVSAGSAQAVAPDIQSGSQDVTSNVNVTFEVR
jgi:hypothetical protein